MSMWFVGSSRMRKFTRFCKRTASFNNTFSPPEREETRFITAAPQK